MAKWWKRALGLTGRDRATALVTEGYVHAREHRLDQALRCYENAVEADEEFAVAHLNLGLARLDAYNRDRLALDDVAREQALDAIAGSLTRANALDAQSPVGFRALAHVEERRLQFAAADDAWAKVEALSPPDSKELGEAKAARKELAQKAAADRARQRALQALDADDAERKAALEELLPHVDAVARGFALAGTLARRLRDKRQAKELLAKAAAHDADDVEALRELASVLLEDGDYAGALAASMDAYRARPTDAGLVCNVGVCHLGLGDWQKAEEFIALAHQLEPKDAIVLRAKDALAKARRSSAADSSGR